MARLHEHEGKAILRRHGFAVPRGGVARTPDEAAGVARSIGGAVVVKIQAWTTGRKALGGVAFADSPDQAAGHARRMLGMRVGQFPVEAVLVEERLALAHEVFLSVSIDDASGCPVLLLSHSGGSGVEGRAGAVRRVACHPVRGPDAAAVRDAVASFAMSPGARDAVQAAALGLFRVARAVEARSVEINPLGITPDAPGASPGVVAIDCRMTVDDYAVFRHPELGIELAREFDHPPTALERIAYAVEQADHRGTFYFAQLATEAPPGSKGLIGFHGAGGGGSMMSMDAITAEGFTLANFCDTSGNPSPAKVYRAARIILAQPGIVGYFGSGSGVANQEQFWSAYGLAKAFWELELDIPAVIRLGGNAEDRAVEVLEGACRAAALPAPVEAYRKNDAPAAIARRFAELVDAARSRARASPGGGWKPRAPRRPAFVGAPASQSLALRGGVLWIDPGAWRSHGARIVERSSGVLRDDAGRAAPTLPQDQFLAKDSELIACEVECRRDGIDGVFVELNVPGLD